MATPVRFWSWVAARKVGSARSSSTHLCVNALAGAEAAGFDGELWTLARIVTVITEHTGVAYHPNYVAELLHRHGWTPQRPARRAAERDDAKIAGWVKQTWPQVTGGSQAKEADRLP